MNMSQYIQIIAVVIVFAIYIYGLFKVIKITRGSSPNKRNIVSGFTLATLLLIYLILNTYIIGPADFVQIILIFGLVLATTLYAFSAAKQANASVKMAEEMREQRLTISQPLLFPDFTEATFPEPGKIWFDNLGSGPAVRLEIKIAYSIPNVVKSAWNERTGQYGSLAGVHGANWNVVKADGRVACQPELTECHPGNIGTAFVEYSDIYGRRFLSGWGYRCEKDSKGDVTLLPTEPIYPIVREGGSSA